MLDNRRQVADRLLSRHGWTARRCAQCHLPIAMLPGERQRRACAKDALERDIARAVVATRKGELANSRGKHDIATRCTVDGHQEESVTHLGHTVARSVEEG